MHVIIYLSIVTLLQKKGKVGSKNNEPRSLFCHSSFFFQEVQFVGIGTYGVELISIQSLCILPIIIGSSSNSSSSNNSSSGNSIRLTTI